MSAARNTSVVGVFAMGGLSLVRSMVIVPDSVPPAPPANVPETSNVVMVSAFAVPTLRARAQSAAASAMLSFDLKDMALVTVRGGRLCDSAAPIPNF